MESHCGLSGLLEATSDTLDTLKAVYETGEELFLGTCDSRSVGGVGVLLNTSMAKNIDSFKQLTTRTSADEKMWSNTSFDYLRRLRSNIKLRRRSRSFLYGPGVLPRRSCLLKGHNSRLQHQSWPN
ncbi:hypothetical protein RB195_010237 [Necator americanus]|uniref:Uncharacterized protein n=1 Tax=Necator americanus TaxID=51031 RepID=A0ABR1CXG6_NECAM